MEWKTDKAMFDEAIKNIQTARKSVEKIYQSFKMDIGTGLVSREIDTECRSFFQAKCLENELDLEIDKLQYMARDMREHFRALDSIKDTIVEESEEVFYEMALEAEKKASMLANGSALSAGQTGAKHGRVFYVHLPDDLL